MSELTTHTAPPEILLPHILDDLANQKQRSKWSYGWQHVTEFWHAMFDKYFVSRDLVKMQGEGDYSTSGDGPKIMCEVEKTDYYNLADRKFYKSPKNATVVGFFSGALAVIALRKKNKEVNYQFSLVPLPELAFIRHVTGADEDGATKNDFR